MKIKKIKCDRCNRIVDDNEVNICVIVPTTREPDPSGNGYIQNSNQYDLCSKCAEALIKVGIQHQEGLIK